MDELMRRLVPPISKPDRGGELRDGFLASGKKMPSWLEACPAELFRVATFLFPGNRRGIRGIETHHDNVVVAARLQRNATQTGNTFVKAQRTHTGTREENKLQDHRLVPEILAKRNRLA